MRKGSKVIKIKYEEDSIFVGAAWGRKRTRWGRKGARLTLEAISDYLKKGAGVHSEEAYLDEVKCDLLRLIRKRLYQQALKDGKEIKEYECQRLCCPCCNFLVLAFCRHNHLLQLFIFHILQNLLHAVNGHLAP